MPELVVRLTADEKRGLLSALSRGYVTHEDVATLQRIDRFPALSGEEFIEEMDALIAELEEWGEMDEISFTQTWEKEPETRALTTHTRDIIKSALKQGYISKEELYVLDAPSHQGLNPGNTPKEGLTLCRMLRDIYSQCETDND